MDSYQGSLAGAGVRVAIVASRFNELITRRLLDGALEMLSRCGVADDDVTVAWVPGAVEIPLVAARLASSGRHQAVITLGAVIRGATGHYEHVCSMVASGVSRASLDSGVPVVFGVLTTDTVEQALERAGSKAGNKGAEAAQTAIEMAGLMQRLPTAP